MAFISTRRYLHYVQEALENGALLEIPCLYTHNDLKSLVTFSKLELRNIGLLDGSQSSKWMSSKRYTNDFEFEVEGILDYVSVKNVQFYYIKWKNWDDTYNTWEPAKNLLKCKHLINKFNYTRTHNSSSPYEKILFFFNKNKIDRFKNIMINPRTHQIYSYNDVKILLNLPSNYPTQLDKLHKFVKFQNALKEWEIYINNIIGYNQIIVENNIDNSYPPKNFTFINDYIPGENVFISDDPPIGCTCQNNCQPILEIDNKPCVRSFPQKLSGWKRNKVCCSSMSGYNFPYNKHGRIILKAGIPIYECNKLCKCDPHLCRFRVVQKGNSKFKFSIFKTDDNRGWGVKTLQRIYKNTFVMEYIGEIITNEEAEKRGQIYDSNGITYLFDLDFCDQDNAFTVDAGYYGNISHFVNHSCDPNLVVYAVYINNLDIRLPRIALFARKDILKGEELTFDYLNSANNNFQSEKGFITKSPSNRINKAMAKHHYYFMDLNYANISLNRYVSPAHNLDLLTPPSSLVSKDSMSNENSESLILEDIKPDIELLKAEVANKMINLEDTPPDTVIEKEAFTDHSLNNSLILYPNDILLNAPISNALKRPSPSDFIPNGNSNKRSYDNKNIIYEKLNQFPEQKNSKSRPNRSIKAPRCNESYKKAASLRIACKCKSINCRKYIF
ncbi:unnamed protein product [Gordionus sp. m RMFG-2023]|uniref:histone-lysine N-methyltransferase SUV39H2-like n=1 Tax=Gordionus sp. m RMFG-2023 TaxID=3053472 RepID=UPI0030E2D00D